MILEVSIHSLTSHLLHVHDVEAPHPPMQGNQRVPPNTGLHESYVPSGLFHLHQNRQL